MTARLKAAKRWREAVYATSRNPYTFAVALDRAVDRLERLEKGAKV